LPIYLLAGDPGVPIGGGAEDQIVEDGGVGRDSDAAAHHHRDLELVPVLVAAPVRTFQTDLLGDGLEKKNHIQCACASTRVVYIPRFTLLIHSLRIQRVNIYCLCMQMANMVHQT